MLTANITDTSTLVIHRTFEVPAAKVFKAWTEPGQMNKWFGCDSTDAVKVTQDFRVGGNYHIEVQCTDREAVIMSGTFLEIIPNRKLIYTWNNTSVEYPANDSLVSVEFVDQGDSTEIILKHSKFDQPISVQGHTMGWTTALDKLEALFT